MKKNTQTFLLLLIVGFVSYYNCFSVFIPADNYSQFFLFDKGFLIGLYENCRGASIYFSGFTFFYLLYKLFQANSVAWISAGLLLHILNSFILYLIVKKNLQSVLTHANALPAFFAALLFLVSPYQAEMVLWTTLLRWQFHAFTFLACLYGLLIYLEAPTHKKLIPLHLLFALCIFSNETAFVLPLIAGLFFAYYFRVKITPLSIKKYGIEILLPQLGWMAAYFIISKLYLGNWLWHGGLPETIMSLSSVVKTALKYLAKFFLLYRYLPYGHWDGYARTVSENQVLIGGVGTLAFLVFSILFIKQMKNKNSHFHLPIILFTAFLMMLVPVLPLDSSFLSYYYPDRYGYLASAFFYSFLSLVLFRLFRAKYRLLVSAYALLNFFLLQKTNCVWIETSQYCHELVAHYRRYLSYDQVYVLNETSYYKGVPAFRAALPETIHYTYSNYNPTKIRIVSGAYQDSYSDSIVSVVVHQKENKVCVKSTPKSTPYFCTGGWARSYHNHEYEVVFNESGCEYELTFKDSIPANSVFIYSNKGCWKTVTSDSQE
jgi:hypothetical protein